VNIIDSQQQLLESMAKVAYPKLPPAQAVSKLLEDDPEGLYDYYMGMNPLRPVSKQGKPKLPREIEEEVGVIRLKDPKKTREAAVAEAFQRRPSAYKRMLGVPD
jgi:hypothetical protein